MQERRVDRECQRKYWETEYQNTCTRFGLYEQCILVCRGDSETVRKPVFSPLIMQALQASVSFFHYSFIV